jgi:hypothetical protein
MYVSKSMTFPTPHIGHSRHGLFFTRLDCQYNAKLSEKDPGFEPGTFGVAVSIPNHHTIEVVLNGVLESNLIRGDPSRRKEFSL